MKKGSLVVLTAILLLCGASVVLLLCKGDQLNPYTGSLLVGLDAASLSTTLGSNGGLNNEQQAQRIRALEDRIQSLEKSMMDPQKQNPSSTAMTTTASNGQWDFQSNPLQIPQGTIPNLPSIQVQDTKTDSVRKDYGGKGDKAHLGGFTSIDTHGISPEVWRNMVTQLGVHSVIDVGCGKGVSTLWFQLQGLDTLCVEGSSDAVSKSLLNKDSVVEHDFSRGPWWPEKTYDAAWSVEFLEHVGVNYHFNYISTFRKAAILFVTSSRWGGWHHVEIHYDEWWIRKYQSYGFLYDEELTNQVRRWAQLERAKSADAAPNGAKYNAQHIALSMKVFINPAVASLPQHAHLFFEHGCMKNRSSGKTVTQLCGQDRNNVESSLPPSFLPLNISATAHEKWHRIVADSIGMPKESEADPEIKQLKQQREQERLQQNQTNDVAS